MFTSMLPLIVLCMLIPWQPPRAERAHGISEVPCVRFGSVDFEGIRRSKTLFEEARGGWTGFFDNSKHFGLAEQLVSLSQKIDVSSKVGDPKLNLGDVLMKWGTPTADSLWASFLQDHNRASDDRFEQLKPLWVELRNDRLVADTRRWYELRRDGDYDAQDSLFLIRSKGDRPALQAGLNERCYMFEAACLLFPEQTGRDNTLPFEFEDAVILWDAAERDVEAIASSSYNQDRLKYVPDGPAAVTGADYRRRGEGKIDPAEFRYELSGRVRRHGQRAGSGFKVTIRAMERITADGCRVLDYFVWDATRLVGRDTLIPVRTGDDRLVAIFVVTQVASDLSDADLTIKESLIGLRLESERRWLSVADASDPSGELRRRWLVNPSPWTKSSAPPR